MTTTSRTSRRRFLRSAAILGCASLVPGFLAGCAAGGESSPTSTASVATPAGSAASQARRGPSKGELRTATSGLPTTLDSDDGTSHFSLLSHGIGETLMRFRADTTAEPWIASKLERVDPLTWRVTLRDDVTFWDGSKCDAEAVRASFERTLSKVAGTDSLIPQGSVLTSGGMTLTIKTPTPSALMPKSLATVELQVKKVIGSDILYTGPFRPTSHTAKELLVAEAYQGYRGGPANIKTLNVRYIPDTEARILALQAGDLDVAESLFPAHLDRLKSGGYTTISGPQARQHMMILNVRRPPFDEVAVRQAVSLAIDRNTLATVLGGPTTPSYSLGPEAMKIPGLFPTQKYDFAEAGRVLDAAGWKAGASGSREKAGKRLEFQITTYPGRAELEQFAVVIVDQMKKLGVGVTIDKVSDITSVINNSTFTASMYSLGQGAFTDISRMLVYLYTPSGTNKDRYNNPQVNDLLATYLANADNAQAIEALKGIQNILAQEVPVVHLVTPSMLHGVAKNVRDLAFAPLEYYRYGTEVSLA